MILDDIASYLATQGRGTVGTNIFKSYLPDSPNACIALYETGGLPPDRYSDLAEPTFQVLVRNDDYASGKTVVDNIVSDLHQTNNTQFGGSDYYYYTFMTGEPAYIGRDKKGRDEFSINFVTLKRR